MSFLQRAVEESRTRVGDAAHLVPLERLRTRAGEVSRPSLATALAGPDVAVIAEVKRASPSRGDLAAIPDPAGLARSYAQGGASAISVLTEPAHFRGSLDDLAAVTAATTLPVLRKDFIVDAYQVWEAAAAGAAAVLLIVAALDQATLEHLARTAAAAGLDALVEVHDRDEVERAVQAHAAAGASRLIVGVNARDLSTLAVDRARYAQMRDALPDDALAVAESGINDPQDVRAFASLGADAVLVGEHVVTSHDPAAAVRALVDAGRRTASP